MFIRKKFLSSLSIKTILLGISLFLFSYTAQAEQKIQRKQWDIHYIAFPSTFIQPDIAKHYDLKRSGTQGVVNISVLDNSKTPSVPLNVNVTGSYRNLVGNFGSLEFKEVVEKGAIYYLAEFPYSNQETFRFEITVSDGVKSETIKFKDQFYVD